MQIVLRALVVFVVLFVVTRVMGKRELSQLSAFELVVLIVMGDLVEQAVTQDDSSLTGATLAVGTFAMLSVALTWTTWRFGRTRAVINGVPAVIVRDGEVLMDVAGYERVSLDELYEAMREHQIRSVREVDLGVLEADGKYSFFTRPADRPAGDG